MKRTLLFARAALLGCTAIAAAASLDPNNPSSKNGLILLQEGRVVCCFKAAPVSKRFLIDPSEGRSNR
jgi:hypothetical protein